ncbi:cytochrome P450 [Coccomyxa subellipsoidea C-169]|uniref:Cytochrome P450 n=1 Tax=Coccomyxa subellipsoidea (strain C-169) TaxID=574566 RepID=I0YQJ2_COCSC|nr:cytochrome P450 [Coccomyxa subellipsoidea C-169]EIE20661.1 cytochrome P450 [Coccomyxa subellipsoidea C-169]|eukprot:XP_005645205.1 cytochrome P450 [Coccomyxa subellipsoidea C-169]
MDDLGLLALRLAVAAIVIWVSTLLSSFCSKALICILDSYKLKHIPGPPNNSLLLGNTAMKSRPDRHRLFTEWAHEYGPVSRRRIMFQHFIQVTDPAIIAEAVRSRELDKKPLAGGGINNFASPKGHYNLLSSPSNERWKAVSPKGNLSLLTSPSNKRWKAVRKAVATAFSTANMRAQFPNIRTACAQLVDVLKTVSADDVVDMDSALCRESLDVIGMVGFGQDLGATRSLASSDESGQAMEATAAAMLEADRRITDPLRMRKFWRKDVKEGKAATLCFHGVMLGLLAGMRRERPAETSIAAHLLDIKDPDTGKPLEDARLLPEISILFMAGFETTGHTAAWTLFSVSQNPKVEAKIVEELKSNGLLATPEKSSPRPIEWDDIPKLTYLNAVIKESMRMYPAGGVATFRTPKGTKDVVLGGGRVVVPPGVGLHMPITAVHHSKDLWEDPEDFKPERFFEDGAEDAKGLDQVNGRTPVRFMPFSMGGRDCVGQTLAKLNLATTLAQLYGNFSFRLADEMGGPEGVKAAECTSITLSCSKGMKMHAVPRVPS